MIPITLKRFVYGVLFVSLCVWQPKLFNDQSNLVMTSSMTGHIIMVAFNSAYLAMFTTWETPLFIHIHTLSQEDKTCRDYKQLTV